MSGVGGEARGRRPFVLTGALLPESAYARHRATSSRGVGAVVMRSLRRHIVVHTSDRASAAHARRTARELRSRCRDRSVEAEASRTPSRLGAHHISAPAAVTKAPQAAAHTNRSQGWKWKRFVGWGDVEGTIFRWGPLKYVIPWRVGSEQAISGQ